MRKTGYDTDSRMTFGSYLKRVQESIAVILDEYIKNYNEEYIEDVTGYFDEAFQIYGQLAYCIRLAERAGDKDSSGRKRAITRIENICEELKYSEILHTDYLDILIDDAVNQIKKIGLISGKGYISQFKCEDHHYYIAQETFISRYSYTPLLESVSKEHFLDAYSDLYFFKRMDDLIETRRDQKVDA